MLLLFNLHNNDCNLWNQWGKICKQTVIRDSDETEKLANGLIRKFGKKIN